MPRPTVDRAVKGLMTRVRMADRAAQGSSLVGDSALRAALARWRGDASTAHLVREGGPLLVLDGAAERILHADGAAQSLRAGVADADGIILPTLRLSAQIGRAGTFDGRPRMVRLRFDPRGVAPPVVALAARAEIEPEFPVLLLAPIGSLPTLRPFEAAPAKDDPVLSRPIPAVAESAAATAGSTPAPEAETADLPVRLIWRSDAEGVLTQVSRTHPDLAEALTSRSWTMLAADGVIEGAALTEALSARRTFRALPLVVHGRSYEHALEISGAPAGRTTDDFSGFGGFAILGERRPRAIEDAIEEGEPALDDTQNAEPAPEPEPGTSLSVNEHAAFREVARVLGLRFAPDEAEDQAPVPAHAESPTGSSVMPFPTPPARLAENETRAQAALTELLESLPLGVLVYRGSEMLFASRTFLDLTGYTDLSALRDAGLAHLFRGLPPREREIIGPVPFARPEGGTVALLVDRAGLVWEGAPAEICLARAMPASGAAQPPAVPPNAARLRAEKVLDSLEEGVVTLDAEGRVVGLNPSAAELVHAHPKEVVGGRFADLFAPESLPALETAVTNSRRSGASEIHGVTPRTGAAALRLRIARLLGEDAPGYCASLREIRDEDVALPVPAVSKPAPRGEPEAEAAWKANALARVSREIRPSLNAILSLTDMMLSDRFDRADAERLEAYLREVRLSGGRIAALIDDLRDLAEIQAGRGKLSFADLALNDLVSSCIATQQAKAARDRIVLRTSLAPDLPAMRADERSIRQATLTVLANAIRVTEAGGQVIISTTLAERGEIALRVRDTGTGMTEDELTSALEPFQADLGSDVEGEEKGFGLTLTKALVEANRGRFRITSRKDEGTLVEMLFPAA